VARRKSRRSSTRHFKSGRKSPMMAAFVGTLGRQVGNQVAGPIGRGAGLIAAGKWAQNETVETLGWIDVGSQLLSGVNLNGLLGGLTGGNATAPAPGPILG